jgi:hypothetical protein
MSQPFVIEDKPSDIVRPEQPKPKPQRTSGAKPKDRSKKQRKRRPRGPPTLAFKVQEFCDSVRLSRSKYYELRKLGLGPVETHIGHVIIITAANAARWLRQREKDARA